MKIMGLKMNVVSKVVLTLVVGCFSIEAMEPDSVPAVEEKTVVQESRAPLFNEVLPRDVEKLMVQTGLQGKTVSEVLRIISEQRGVSRAWYHALHDSNVLRSIVHTCVYPESERKYAVVLEYFRAYLVSVLSKKELPYKERELLKYLLILERWTLFDIFGFLMKGPGLTPEDLKEDPKLLKCILAFEMHVEMIKDLFPAPLPPLSLLRQAPPARDLYHRVFSGKFAPLRADEQVLESIQDDLKRVLDDIEDNFSTERRQCRKHSFEGCFVDLSEIDGLSDSRLIARIKRKCNLMTLDAVSLLRELSLQCTLTSLEEKFLYGVVQGDCAFLKEVSSEERLSSALINWALILALKTGHLECAELLLLIPLEEERRLDRNSALTALEMAIGRFPLDFCEKLDRYYGGLGGRDLVSWLFACVTEDLDVVRGLMPGDRLIGSIGMVVSLRRGSLMAVKMLMENNPNYLEDLLLYIRDHDTSGQIKEVFSVHPLVIASAHQALNFEAGERIADLLSKEWVMYFLEEKLWLSQNMLNIIHAAQNGYLSEFHENDVEETSPLCLHLALLAAVAHGQTAVALKIIGALSQNEMDTPEAELYKKLLLWTLEIAVYNQQNESFEALLPMCEILADREMIREALTFAFQVRIAHETSFEGFDKSLQKASNLNPKLFQRRGAREPLRVPSRKWLKAVWENNLQEVEVGLRGNECSHGILKELLSRWVAKYGSDDIKSLFMRFSKW